MSFVEKLFAEKNSLNLSQAQKAAYQNVQLEFSKAWNSRNSQINYNNMPAYNPASKFNIDGGLTIGDKHFYTTAEDKAKNEIEIKEIVKTAYKKLSYALDNPFIKDHLEDNIKELKSNLNEAARSGNYAKVDNFFDNFSNLAKRKSGVSAELINLSSLEKENPAPANAGQGNSFVNKVTSTIRNLSTMSRS
jgi:hypothetical protein